MKIITTNYNEKLFWEETTTELNEVGCMNVINVYPECKMQKMYGFGGSFTEAAGYNYSKLSTEAKKEFIDAYFSEDGLRYSTGRTHINSCDFALSNYAAVTDEKDTTLSTFHLEREEEYILPLIRDAIKVSKESIKFLLSPWSPPAFMKTNHDMNHGGSLKKEYYLAWANYLAKYIKEMKLKGIDVQYLSVQNEPEATQTWDSCRYSAQEEMEFVRDFLGPVLEMEELEEIKILVWDHNKETVYDRAKAIFKDEKAAKYIYGIAVHWYTGDHFEALRLVKDKYPQKEIFFTEGCVEYSRFMDSNEVSKAQMYAHDMIGNFTHGVSAFFDWNLLLDAAGGPNHVKNFCAAPIMCTEDERGIKKRLSYYYIGHFSRYIKKNAHCIAITRYTTKLDVCAFLNPDQERVIVMMNGTKSNINVTLREGNQGKDLVLQPHSIITVCYK